MQQVRCYGGLASLRVCGNCRRDRGEASFSSSYGEVSPPREVDYRHLSTADRCLVSCSSGVYTIADCRRLPKVGILGENVVLVMRSHRQTSNSIRSGQ
jgi:hypothetical protein